MRYFFLDAIIVVDTNILVAALRRGSGSARAVVRACLNAQYQAVLGPALLAEYEDVLGRAALWQKTPSVRVSASERAAVLDAFLQNCRWVEVYFAWRPNLPDEADNHLIELALAGQASAIVTRNLRDLRGGELKFPTLQVLTPKEAWETLLCQL